MVITVLEQKGGHWLSPSRMMKYQIVLTEQDDVILKTTNLVNPAVFLSSIQEEGRLEHDCLATIEYVYSSREDLKDVPLERPDWELYTDGSSFMEQGVRYAGYAEHWRGPFQILLTTFTAIKIAESDAWIHYTRVKKAP
ncbi:uncharacterized protein LOC129734872 isoform X2 [Falco cherrug]|uniref:uncharacterized protein LOC129734871 isoform X2 n=1 Tax=Falco cherrug TaxID=345164 RepID=UPI00247A5DFC|nr:uncharacterized protein LOC129734871 isoform X2 [Falco cherrug]XP_055556199.1 uncharacterized protein LOC129734872 isoform X2 [Falco cherrug]